jgi:hypothetical protein
MVVPPSLPAALAPVDNDAMGIIRYAFRATWRRHWRIALVVALIGGLLGAISMTALAGARRTDSAYGRYLRAVKASDVLIDVPGPLASWPASIAARTSAARILHSE